MLSGSDYRAKKQAQHAVAGVAAGVGAAPAYAGEQHEGLPVQTSYYRKHTREVMLKVEGAEASQPAGEAERATEGEGGAPPGQGAAHSAGKSDGATEGAAGEGKADGAAEGAAAAEAPGKGGGAPERCLAYNALHTEYVY